MLLSQNHNFQNLRSKKLFPNIQSESVLFVAPIIQFTAIKKSLALSSLLFPIE